jgi:hypothetical protein
MYYLQTRFYDPQLRRFINADSTDYLDPTTIGGLNLFSYCNNNPVMFTDGSGSRPDWTTFFRGIGRIITGIFAVVTGIAVIASGVALIPMLIVAGVTITAGALTVVNGAADVGQGFSGYNFMRDGVFGGNQTAYDWYSGVTEAVAIVGSAISGGWLKYNQPRIQSYKNIGNYKFSGTLSRADHMARPFQSSVLTQQQVIKYGKMIKESTNVYKFLAPGATMNSVGDWKLVVDIFQQVIYHFGIGF